MTKRQALKLAAIAVSFLATGGAALAQSAACNSYRAELASMGRSSGSGNSQRDYAQAAGQYQALGCNQFFGAPTACVGIGQRMRAAQSSYYAPSYANEGRRQQLIAAISAYCQPGDDGLHRILSPEEEAQRRARRERDRRAKADNNEVRAVGGSRLVCVRACDGYFFPVANTPDGRGGANEMCQALCPGAQASAYKMPLDGEIQQAVSMSGKAYSALPAALRYQKGADPSCACRKPGESWAQTLRSAEALIDRKKGDIYVTAAKSEELSRAKPTRAKTKTELAKAKTAPADGPISSYTSAAPAVAPKLSDDAETDAALKAKVATAGKQSAGIGPKLIEGDKVIGKNVGPMQEVADEDGTKRSVRVIAPDVVPVPQAPSTP